MHRQLSFKNDRSTLYLVATPIGNLSELNLRAIEILKSVDYIACEDTRTSMILLKKYDIKTKLISYHNFNEKESTKGIIKILSENKNVALISDAGYPLISDPGFELVDACINENFNVVTISGANAALNALVASGLASNHYYFYGFLSAKHNEAYRQLENLKEFLDTMIFYESPNRLKRTLKLMYEIFGDRKICIARELTKQYEEYIRGYLSECFDLDELKGEMVLIVEGYQAKTVYIDYGQLLNEVNSYIKQGLTTKDAISIVASKNQVPKKQIYNLYHAN